MTALTKREEIRQNVKATDKESERLIQILKEPIQRYENQKIQKRLSELNKLVDSLSAEAATTLYKRLNNKGDYLSQLFHYELSSPTRKRILDKLKDHQNRR